MAISYYNFENIEPLKNNYIINFYKEFKFDDEHILITTDHGGWVVLNKHEHYLLRFNKLDQNPNLRSLLEEKGILITENNRDFIYDAIKNKLDHTQRGTALHIIVPTLRCNHKCVYCHAKSRDPSDTSYNMDQETAKATVDFIFTTPSPSFTIEFQGGEPLLNFPIVKFIHQYSLERNRYANRKIRFVIVTNLTEMTEEIKKYVVDNKIDICTSLDGPKELHDKNRLFVNDSRSSYDAVIEKFMELEKVMRFSCLPTITKESLKYPRAIVDEYLRLGFDGIMSRNMNYAGFAKETWKKIGYTSEEYLKFWKEHFDYILDVNARGIKFIDSKMVHVLQRVVSMKPRMFTCFGSPCGAVVGQIAYTQSGDIHTCDESRSFDLFRLGNVKTDTFQTIIKKSARFIGLTSCVASLCDACVWHPFCGNCVVATYGAQNNVISKLAWDHECKIRREQLKYLFEKLIFHQKHREVLMSWIYPKRFGLGRKK